MCLEVNRRPGVTLVGTLPLMIFIVTVMNVYHCGLPLHALECSLPVVSVHCVPCLPRRVQLSLKEHFCGSLQPAALVDLLQVRWTPQAEAELPCAVHRLLACVCGV